MQRCHTYKLQSQNIFKESTGGGGGGGGVGWRGQGRCEQRSEVFVKNREKKYGGGGVSGR